MIVVRAPLRISFVGGGTDLPDFYRRHPGRVISTAIDKFVYVAINRTPLIPKVSARYSISETVDRPSDLQETAIKKGAFFFLGRQGNRNRFVRELAGQNRTRFFLEFFSRPHERFACLYR